MKKVSALILLLGLSAFFSACGNGYNGMSVTPAQVSVTVTPASVSVQTGKQVQFMASVMNTSNTAVTWQVNGTTGGGTGTGTITTGGLYTAPSSVPSGQIMVTAVSQADTTVSATAMVTVTAATATLSISPASATVLAGATQQFTATASGASAAVTWQVNGTAGGSSALGTISTGGLYTAPTTPPSGQKVTITAVAQANASESAAAPVTVVPSVATLKGLYAFSVKGYNASGLLLEAGSFQADGKGNVTSGEEDVNSGAGIFGPVTFTGSYTVGTDGRTTLQINPPVSTGLNSETFDVVLTSGTHGRLIRFDSFATGIGSLDLQDSSAFNAAALKGNLIVSLDGTDITGAINSTAGIGLLSFDGSSAVSSGLLDLNDNGSSTTGNAVSGTYTLDSPATNGRGEFSVAGSAGTFDFVFYIVGTGQIKLISTDTSPVWGGTAQVQTSSSFSNASLRGGVVFLAEGVNSNGTLADAGRFTSTAGGTLSDGTGDENSNGTVTSGYAFTGTYTIDSTGHGTLQVVNSSLGNANYTFYLASDSQGVLMTTDAAFATIGVIDEQAETLFTPVTDSSLGFTLDGISSTGPIDKLGQISSSSGKGSEDVISEDVNGITSLNPNVAITSTQTTGANGVGKLTIAGGGSSRSLDVYMISNSEMLLIGLDTDQVLGGGMEQQFP